MIDIKRTTVISGDFNICFRKNRTNLITTTLEKNGFTQLQKDASHNKGGHLDHVYWCDPTDKWNLPVLERHSVYYSDHDSVLISLSKKPVKRSKLSRRNNNKKQKVT